MDILNITAMKDISYIIIIALFALLFLQRECSRPPQQPPQPDTIRYTEIIYDTIPITKPVPVPYPVHIVDSFMIPPVIDTAAIIKDFIALRIYDRILLDDTTAFIRVTDSVTHNRLMGAALQYINRRPTITKTTNIIYPPPPQRFQLYAAGFISFANTKEPRLHGAGASVFAKTRKDHIYGAGYDVMNKSLQIHAAWKINIK